MYQEVNWEQVLDALRGVDPKRQAEQFESQGLQGRNPDAMRRAAHYWRLGAEADKERQCEAFALWFEGKYQAAAQVFESLGQYEKSWECYWDGVCLDPSQALRCWQALAGWPRPHTRPEAGPMARFMVAPSESAEAVAAFSAFIEGELTRGRTDWVGSHWRLVFQELANRIPTVRQAAVGRDLWAALARTAEAVASKGFVSLRVVSAWAYWHAGAYDKAVGAWDTVSSKPYQYHIAKAEADLYPKGFEHLQRVTDAQLRDNWIWGTPPAPERSARAWLILQKWRAGGRPVSGGWVDHVRWASGQLGEYREVFEALWSHRNEDQADIIAEFCREALRRGEIPQNQASEVVAWLMDQSCWVEAAKTLGAALASWGLRDAALLELGWSFIRRFASAEPLRGKDGSPEVAELLEQLYRDSQWRNKVSITELGSAFERAGWITSSLKFYEPFTEDPDGMIRQWARERWLLNKKRHSRRERGRREELEKEADSKASAWGISLQAIDSLPEFPKLTSLAAREAKPIQAPEDWQKQPLTRGNLAFVSDKLRLQLETQWQHGWLRLTELTTGDELIVHFLQRRFRGTLAHQIVHDSSSELRVKLPTVNVEILFELLEENVNVSLLLPHPELPLMVQLPSAAGANPETR